MSNLIGKKILIEKSTELSRTLHKFINLRESYRFTKKGKYEKENELSSLRIKIDALVKKDITDALNIQDWVLDFTKPCSMREMGLGLANFYVEVVSMEEKEE